MGLLLFFIAVAAIALSVALRTIFHPKETWLQLCIAYSQISAGLRAFQKRVLQYKHFQLIYILTMPFLILLAWITVTIVHPTSSVLAVGPIVSLDWDVVDWIPPNLTQVFPGIGGPAGQADVTVSFAVDPDCLVQPPDDTTTITGGFPITESLLILVDDYNDPTCSDSFTDVNISFSHPGGVTNLVVPVLDLDNNANYIDQVFISATDGTNTYLANDPQSTVIFTNTQVTYDGVSTFTAFGGLVPNDQSAGNVIVGFGQPGIKMVTVRYQNGNPVGTFQGISLGAIFFAATTQADLELGKTVSNAVPNVGDTITFTLTILNKGPDPATGVTVSDNLPNGFTFVSATPSQGTYNNGTGIWDVGGLAVNGTATLNMRVTVNASPPATDYTNRAQVASSDQLDPDSTPGNGTTNGEDDEASASIVPPGSPRADLAINKVSRPNPYVAGGPITYTIVVSNLGPDSVNTITVTDNLPAQIQGPTYTPSSGTYNPGTGVWTGITLNANNSVTLTIVGTVQAGFNGVLQNTATVASPLPDPNPNNNMEPDINQPIADLTITKVSRPNPFVVGGPITYTIVVANLGPSAVNVVTVTDNLPPQIQSPTYTPSSGTYNSGTGVWTGITLNANNSVTLTIVGTVQAGFNGVLQNTATVASPLPDPDPSNNMESDTNGTNLGAGVPSKGGDSDSSKDDDDDNNNVPPPPPAAPTPTVVPSSASQPTSELPVLLLPETGLRENSLNTGMISMIVITLIIASVGSVVYMVRKNSRNGR